MTRRVLITGGAAQLAGALLPAFAPTGEVRAPRHGELDITDEHAVREYVAAFNPTLILNCASYNNVDQAEDEPEAALLVNTFGVRVLAKAATECGATLVHYSTDFVFDGQGTRPYTEDDAPNPQSVYASSKLLGEWFALEASSAYVLRVASLFGGVQAKSSIDRIVDAIIDGRDARVFSDRTASPSYVVDVAAATSALVTRGAPGLYHCVDSGYCTWHQLAIEAAKLLGVESGARLIPVPVADVPLRAARPRFAALSNAKIAAVTPMPTWRDALSRYLEVRRLRPTAPL
jgi:dTDP-4-dehydrorhamnose reductase